MKRLIQLEKRTGSFFSEFHSEVIRSKSEPMLITFYCLKTRNLVMLNLQLTDESTCSFSLVDAKSKHLFSLSIDSKIEDLTQLLSLIFCADPQSEISKISGRESYTTYSNIPLNSTLYNLVAYSELGKVAISDNNRKIVSIMFFNRYLDSETTEILNILQSLHEFFVLFQFSKKAKMSVNSELETHYERMIQLFDDLIGFNFKGENDRKNTLDLREWICYIQCATEIISAA